jgi:hypothetical protein
LYGHFKKNNKIKLSKWQDHGHNFALPFLSNDNSNKKKKLYNLLSSYTYKT